LGQVLKEADGFSIGSSALPEADHGLIAPYNMSLQSNQMTACLYA
jgi:hypothetical protein